MFIALVSNFSKQKLTFWSMNIEMMDGNLELYRVNHSAIRFIKVITVEY